MQKFLRYTKIVFLHNLSETLRNPVWVIFGMFQPIVYLVLFAPFLSPLSELGNFPADNAIQFFVPNVLIMLAMFNTAFVGFSLIDKLRNGVLERFRVTPVSRPALVFGLVLRDGVTLLVQSTLLMIGALFFGFRADIFGLLLLFVLLLLIGITMASISYSLALKLKNEGALASTTNFFILPLFILAGVLLPLEFAPDWIQIVAMVNPFSFAVEAARLLVHGSFLSSPIIITFSIFIILSLVTLRILIQIIKEAVA